MAPLKGREFCLAHDPLGQPKAPSATPDQPSPDPIGPVEAPKTRREVRELLQRTIGGVLRGVLDPRRGKVVQDLSRQLLPLLPPDEEPAQYSGLSDEQLLERLEREAEIVRRRIAAHVVPSGSNGKSQAVAS